MQLYPWLVFVHLLGVVGFVAAHGVSMWTAFAIRRARDRDVLIALLGLSKRAVGHTYAGLLLLAIGGLGAAWVSGQLLATWVVGSYVVLAAALISMWAIASPYYVRLRRTLEGEAVTDPESLEALLRSGRPVILLLVGLFALVLLVWLMVLKPG